MYAYLDWVRRLLEKGFDFNDNSVTGAPVGEINYSPWTEAFQDQQHREKATLGVLQLLRLRSLQVAQNFTEFMIPRYGQSHWTFGPQGKFWYAEGLSGNAAIWVRKDSTEPNASEMTSPLFPVGAGKTYRLTARWKSDSVTANRFSLHLVTFQSDRQTPSAAGGYLLNPSPPFTFPGTNGVWQYESRIFTVGNDDRWAAIHLNVNILGGSDNVYIDEIRLEEVGPSFRAQRATSSQLITAGSTTTVVFNSESADYGSQYDTSNGLFTCTEPGRYLFSWNVQLNGVADQQEMESQLYLNGVAVAGGGTGSASGAGQHVGQAGSYLVELERGDIVHVRVFNGDTVDRNVVASATNFFCGGKV